MNRLPYDDVRIIEKSATLSGRSLCKGLAMLGVDLRRHDDVLGK